MESRRELNKGALRQPQAPSFRPTLRAGASQVRCGPNPRKRDTVLAAVKDASRRLWRWPKGAILDGGCARCHWANAGRDEETALGRTKKLIKRRGRKPTRSGLINRAGLQPCRSKAPCTELALKLSISSSNCRVSSRSKMSTINPVAHAQAQTRAAAPSPGAQGRADLSPQAGRGEPHTGKLSCFLPGISTVLPRSMASARAMRGRVACGMITSSI